jgi:hypothetical protein
MTKSYESIVLKYAVFSYTQIFYSFEIENSDFCQNLSFCICQNIFFAKISTIHLECLYVYAYLISDFFES